MDFFIPSKLIFSLNNITKDTFNDYINTIFNINDIKKYYNYSINFTGKSTTLDNCYIEITQYFEDGSKLVEKIGLNQPYLCSSYFLKSFSFRIYINDFHPINLEILENRIDFNTCTTTLPNKLKTFLEKINSESTETYLNPTYNTKMACILDEFSFNCFKYDVDIINLPYKNSLDELINFNPDILFIESAWNGYNNDWYGKIASKNDVLDENILNLLNYCKNNNIPTVFWNKEGLTNFNFFKKYTYLFDYVLVTDENLINEYKQFDENLSLHVLPFFAQPKIHNSINKNKNKLGEIAFAGSWYGDKHIERQQDINVILKPSLNFSLDIFDRNYNNKTYLQYINMYWPTEYLDHILGSVSYKEVTHIYRNYDLFLNINSVQNSKYMTSRRIYEILCSKTPILSSYSIATETVFSDNVYMSRNEMATEDIIREVLNNPIDSIKKAKRSQRFILENHTCQNRLEYLLNLLDIPFTNKTSPSVCLLCFIFDESNVKNLYNTILSQNYNCSHYLIIYNKSIDINLLTTLYSNYNISIDFFGFDNNFSCLDLYNHILQCNYSFDYYAFINASFFYGCNYIRDYANTIKFLNTSPDIIGKNHIYTDLDIDSNLLEKNCDDYFDSYCSSIYLYTSFISVTCLNTVLNSIVITPYNTVYTNYDLNIYSDDNFNFSTNLNISSFVSI